MDTKHFQVSHKGISLKYRFDTLSGTVLETDQRSDSHVFGGGATVVQNGSGGGGVAITTKVEVVRDIWIKDEAGAEHHLRLNSDIPVRTGNMIHFITLKGEHLKGDSGGGRPMALYNSTSRELWRFFDFDKITSHLVEIPFSLERMMKINRSWYIAILVGFPIFFAALPVYSFFVMIFLYFAGKAPMSTEIAAQKQIKTELDGYLSQISQLG